MHPDHERGHKFESQWAKGAFLGVKDNTTEKIVGTSQGVFTVQSIRRKSGIEKYDIELLRSISGLPWDPQAVREEPVPGLPQQPPLAIQDQPDEPLLDREHPVQGKKKSLKRLHITKRDLDKHGYTAGCPACDATQLAKRTSGIQHTQKCRERVEQKIRDEEGNPRVVRHESRVGEALTGLPQPITAKLPRVLRGYKSDRPRGIPSTCKVFATLDEGAICFQTTLPEGPDWERVWHRVIRNHRNNEIIESGRMVGVADLILNAPLPHEMDIVTELWYEDPGVNLGGEQASGSGSRRRAREEDPQGQKRIPEEPHEAESPTSRARTSQATSAKRKAEGEHEAEEA